MSLSVRKSDLQFRLKLRQFVWVGFQVQRVLPLRLCLGRPSSFPVRITQMIMN